MTRTRAGGRRGWTLPRDCQRFPLLRGRLSGAAGRAPRSRSWAVRQWMDDNKAGLLRPRVAGTLCLMET
eukprot:5417597-Prymnesium_polylepis.1